VDDVQDLYLEHVSRLCAFDGHGSGEGVDSVPFQAVKDVQGRLRGELSVGGLGTVEHDHVP
jgi:hypothetical protein